MAGSGFCKVLNVAEKNDAARELANIMARGRAQRVRKLYSCKNLNIIFFFRGKVSLNTIKYMNLISIYLERYFNYVTAITSVVNAPFKL